MLESIQLPNMRSPKHIQHKANMFCSFLEIYYTSNVNLYASGDTVVDLQL